MAPTTSQVDAIGTALAACRRGTHRFRSPRDTGGGIARHIRSAGGAVSIDVSRADEPVGRPPGGPGRGT